MEQAIRIFIKSLLYTAVLPIFGFVIFGILTIFPLFGLLLGPYLLVFIYTAGALPCFVTALCFEIWFRDMRLRQSLLATSGTGAFTSIGWLLVSDAFPDRLSGGALYVSFALGFAGALTAAIIPLAHRAVPAKETNPYSLYSEDS